LPLDTTHIKGRLHFSLTTRPAITALYLVSLAKTLVGAVFGRMFGGSILTAVAALEIVANIVTHLHQLSVSGSQLRACSTFWVGEFFQ
jgi:hypothetical protein